jgi:hypothetical protein
MSSDKSKILKKIKGSTHILHPESGLVFKSAKDRIVIGRYENSEIVSLDKKTVELCETWKFNYDKTIISEDEEDGEEAEEEAEAEAEAEEEAEGEEAEEVEGGGEEENDEGGDEEVDKEDNPKEDQFEVAKVEHTEEEQGKEEIKAVVEPEKPVATNNDTSLCVSSVNVKFQDNLNKLCASFSTDVLKLENDYVNKVNTLTQQLQSKTKEYNDVKEQYDKLKQKFDGIKSLFNV